LERRCTPTRLQASHVLKTIIFTVTILLNVKTFFEEPAASIIGVVYRLSTPVMVAEGSFGTSVYTYQTAGVARFEDNLHSHHSDNLKFGICNGRLKFPPYNLECKITLHDRNVT